MAGSLLRYSYELRLVGLLALIALLSSTNSLQGKECAGLNIGLSPTYHDVVAQGQVSPDWQYDPETSSKPRRRIQNKQSEYLYVTYTGSGSLEEKDFNVIDKAKDLYMTLFKATKVRENYFTISLMYMCSPLTHSVNQIITEITPPGCSKVELSWSKVCGDMMGRLELTKLLIQDCRRISPMKTARRSSSSETDFRCIPI